MEMEQKMKKKLKSLEKTPSPGKRPSNVALRRAWEKGLNRPPSRALESAKPQKTPVRLLMVALLGT